MSIMSGLELCQEIRKKDKKTPIVIVSNYCDKEKLVSLIPLNLTSYLVKPIIYDNIITTLKGIVHDTKNFKLCICTIGKIYNENVKRMTVLAE